MIIGETIIILIGCILSAIFKIGLISNIAWTVCGLFIIIFPAWPERWENFYSKEKCRLIMRVTGVVVIALGWLIKFGV